MPLRKDDLDRAWLRRGRWPGAAGARCPRWALQGQSRAELPDYVEIVPAAIRQALFADRERTLEEWLRVGKAALPCIEPSHSSTAPRSRISNQPPQASHFQKCSASLNGGPPVCLPMIFPRGIVGVMRAILVTMVSSVYRTILYALARFRRGAGAIASASVNQRVRAGQAASLLAEAPC